MGTMMVITPSLLLASSLFLTESVFGKIQGPVVAFTSPQTSVSNVTLTTTGTAIAVPLGTVRCPRPNDPPKPLKPNTVISIYKAPVGSLCTLTKTVVSDPAAGQVHIVPYGRSYGGRDWEGYGGAEDPPLSFNCAAKQCTTTVPPLEAGEAGSAVFHLRGFQHTATDEERVARFLEQATFGPTSSLLNSWEYGESSMAEWVLGQMNDVPATEHRRVYRESVGTRMFRSEEMGRPRHPCESHSRWRALQFTYEDNSRWLSVSCQGPPHLLYVDGQPRTEIPVVPPEILCDTPYRICRSGNEINDRISVRTGVCTEILRNDYIEFEVSPPAPDYAIVESDGEVVVDPPEMWEELFPGFEFLTPDPLTYNFCDTYPVVGTGGLPIFRTTTFRFPSAGNVTFTLWWNHDPFLVLERNTLNEPIPDGGAVNTYHGAECSNVPRTFLNAESCKLSTQLQTCGPFEFVADAELTLDHETNVKLHELTGKYVYAANDLRPEPNTYIPDYSPCVAGMTSRWIKLPDETSATCASDPLLDGPTRATLVNTLRSSDDENPILRDIDISSGATCNPPGTVETMVFVPDLMSIGGRRRDLQTATATNQLPIDGKGKPGTRPTIAGTCWKHVHPDHFNVYDFTPWTKIDTHPGNMGNPNAIKQFAQAGSAVLNFPNWHDMERWEMNVDVGFNFMGRYGDTIQFVDLPDDMRTEAVALEFGAAGESGGGEGAVVCGSPAEVANDPSIDPPLFDAAYRTDIDDTATVLDHEHQKGTIFVAAALIAPDQLRQRTAWALQQIVALATGDVDAPFDTECYVAWHDIFVRNAFGNYRDILREISHSPMMGEMLSFLQSKSSQYVLETSPSLGYVFPDENFAREIMQLFSIGQTKLNLDGTLARDSAGSIIQVYNNDDIIDGARAWTAFDRQADRGNVESLDDKNRIDPMRVFANWRDAFPKMLLGPSYVGDGYPLCEDLPEKAFLRVGATYRLLGSKTAPELQEDDSKFANDDTVQRLVLDPEFSGLYGVLCGSPGNVTTECDFPSQVVLDANLPCHGMECDVDAARVVQVNNRTYYEYIRRPCVELSFFDDGTKIATRDQGLAMCANKKTAVASEACCESGGVGGEAHKACEYVGERVLYGTAQDRCAAIGRETCDFSYVKISGDSYCEALGGCCLDREGYYWTDATCEIKFKVNADGRVAIVHEPSSLSQDVKQHVSEETKNWFRVLWANDSYPNVDNGCGAGVCQIYGGDSCLCTPSILTEAAFADYPTSLDDILSSLHIGGVEPEAYDEGTFSDPVTLTFGEETVHVYVPTNGQFQDALIRLTLNGQPQVLKNVASTVQLAGAYQFRNVPHFMNLATADTRDAQHETEAVIDRYFLHPNTAPFISYRLMQRFGHSNPSPSFIERVATAFQTGFYVWNTDISFGTGSYGDLAATTAAILLDHESTSVELDADPAKGSLREPLLKVLHMMRALEYEAGEVTPLPMLIGLQDKIGQMAHQIPSVFSFFLPDYSPFGVVGSASLVSPEAYGLSTPKVLGVAGGLMSLVQYGLSPCNDAVGFGPDIGNGCASIGSLTYTPTSVATGLDELALLLTCGRLSGESRTIIGEAAQLAPDEATMLKIAEQLILTSPEFHSTNLVERSGEVRPSPPEPEPSNATYKAVVYLFLDGGADTYNMLVPHSGCTGTDMYAEYASVRGELALNQNDLLQINSGGSQDCTTFGVHPDLSMLKDLYNQNDLAFFANMGVLLEPATTDDYLGKAPSNLFAHDAQKLETKVIDPFQEIAGTGVLGRMTDALTARGFQTGSLSLDDVAEVLVGEPNQSPYTVFVDSGGVNPFDPNPLSDEVLPAIKDINNATSLSSGLFGETWSLKLHQALYENEALIEALDGADLSTEFPNDSLGRDFEMAAKIIKSHTTRFTDRDFIHMNHGGYDTHQNLESSLKARFESVNAAIGSFVAEMQSQGVWDNMVLVVASEFARTLTPNTSGGSDHGWGGNYLILGGGVNGGNIFGAYPDDLTTSGELVIDSRGRIIPSTPWDAVWNGVAEFMGVTDDDDLDQVLPNRENFPGQLYTESDLFTGRRRRNLRQE